MTTRRDFLSVAAASAAATMISRPAFGQETPDTLPLNPARGGKWRPPYRLGMGGAPMAHAGPARPNGPVLEAVEASWDAGVRYFDTSPWYNLGLGERRFGVALHGKPREDYIISTKVGRILTPSTDGPAQVSWENPPSFDYAYDYSAEATRRSIEESLQRMGTPYIDIVLIHDISPDNGDMGEDWIEYFNQAADGAMPELTRMREEGLIKAWGMGVNTLEPSIRSFEVADPDLVLQACKYSLIDHEDMIERLFPVVERAGASIIVASPFNNGFLAGRERYNYLGEIPEGAIARRARLSELAVAHDTDLRTAALHFCNAPELVSAIIPGSRNLRQSVENAASMRTTVPAAFYQEAVAEGLISETAPLPST